MKKNGYRSIRKLISTSMILVPFVPFILIVGIGFSHFKGSIEDNTLAHMNRIAKDHSQMIEGFLDERRSDLELITGLYSFEELTDPVNLRRVFDRLQKKSRAFMDLGLFNAHGLHVAYHGPFSLTGKIYEHEQWFKKVMKHGYYVSDVFLGYRNIPHFVIAIATGTGDQKWALRATIDSHTFCTLVNAVHMGATGEAYILNKDGIFQTMRRSGGGLMEKMPDKLNLQTISSDIHTFIKEDENGKVYLYATAWMKDKSWVLVVRQGKQDAFRTLTQTVYFTIIVMVLGGVTIVITALYMTGRIVSKIEQADSEKEQLSHQLIGASRLAELGEMAAGFAHEINNPLQIIKSEQALVEILFSELKEKGDLKESESLLEILDSMDQINLQVSRCSRITQAILKFGRQNEFSDQDVDLKVFIPEVIEMVAKKAEVNGISITRHIDHTTGAVHGDPAQLQQVLLNLFNNAIHAIDQRHGSSGGALTIEAGPYENKTVRVQVKDNGCGIRRENLKKIFSPFFTTKPVGEGTGLGLSVCYGIIEKMGGIMRVSSKEGQGTVFSIQLPVSGSA